MTNRTKIIIGVGGFILLCFVVGVTTIPKDESSSPSPSTTPPAPDTGNKSSEKNLTLAAYEKIAAGMTYDEVAELAGFEGTSMSVVEIEGVPKTEVFMWQNKFGSNMNVTFQDGKMVSKAQFGLK